MSIHEIESKTLLRRSKSVDAWFISRFHLNLYRGCLHNCIYCDGRSEKYAVEGEFGEDVTVKTNAIELLERELDPACRRKPLPRGFLCFGGGVGDAWQPVEKEYCLARGALKIAAACGRPVHVLTKSCLVERDFDILEEINRKSRAILSMSFSSIDGEMSAFLEPGVPSPEDRLRVLRDAKKRGLFSGMFLMPVVPFLTDTHEKIAEAVAAAAAAGLDYVIFSGMTLKSGRQSEYFLGEMKNRHPETAHRIAGLYERTGPYGNPPDEYIKSVHERYRNACIDQRMPVRIPAEIFRSVVEPDDYALCLLQHIDYMMGLRGKHSGLGYAAYVLGQAGITLEEMRRRKMVLKGVNRRAHQLIEEILVTGTAVEYEKLLRFEDFVTI